MKGIEQLEHTIHHLASPKRAHTFWGLLAVLLLTAGIMWFQHSEAWLNAPNDHYLATSPDGVKNYMTNAWHVRHDSSYVHYRGMNYPFGEHVLFTDNQPVISAAMQWWSANISKLSDSTTGVVNMSLVLSMILGAGIIYLLLRKLHLPVWYASAVALGMVFFSPQYLRFDGHFGLSHTWIIPLLLLLLCNYEERYSRRYQSLQIGVLVWLAAQIHFYYFGLAALFLTLYTGFQLLRDFSWRNLRVRMSHWVVMVLLPFALLNIWLHWSDYSTDRPANPYGFTVYIASWEGVLMPYESFPLFQWIDRNIVPIRRVGSGEGAAYAGFLAFLYTLWLLVSRFKMFEKTWDEAAYHRVHKHYLRGIFFAAFVLLIFACGFPFAIKGMEWIVDYMGPLRQFRGLGRFTWAYYYVVNVLVFYSLWNWSARFKGFKNGKTPWFKWVIALAPLAFLWYEAYELQQMKKITPAPNLAKREMVAASPDHWLNKVDFSRYQALLPLPYYHMGSENIWLDFDNVHFSMTQMTALHTGVPDMGVNMSRTSVGETVRSIQFVTEPCELPAMLSELPDNRPLALMVYPAKWDEVQKKYPHLIRPAKTLYESPEIKIFELSLDSLRAYINRHAQETERSIDTVVVHRTAGWLSNRTDKNFIYQSYDSLPEAPKVFQGKGAYRGNVGDTTYLWKGPLAPGKYTVNFWIDVSRDMGFNHEIKIVQNALSDGHEIHFQHEGLRFYLKTIVGDWGLFEVEFNVLEPQSTTRLFLLKEKVRETFLLDEVLIRPAGTLLFKREAGWFVRNNYWYRRS